MNIIVPKEDFMRIRVGFSVDENIARKYNELFERYECFSKLSYYHRPTNKTIEKKKPPYASYDKRPGKKSFTSMWNILNESNYAKISHRLKFMVTNDNIESIIQDIVHMSIVHSIYRKYFLLVLRDVMQMHASSMKYLQATIVSFDDKYYIFTPRQDMTTYDVFCAKQKHKQTIFNTVSLLLDLQKQYASLDINFTDILNSIFTMYETHFTDEYYVDIFLNILLLVHEEHPDIVTSKLKSTEDYWTCLSKEHISKKTVFLLEKIKNMSPQPLCVH